MVGLSAPVSMLEVEMAMLCQKIKHLNDHIATLLSTIHSFQRAISSLQDAAFAAERDNLDLEFGGGQEAEKIEEDSDGNPNASDNRSDAANDASKGANSGDRSDGGDGVGDDAFEVFNHVDSDETVASESKGAVV